MNIHRVPTALISNILAALSGEIEAASDLHPFAAAMDPPIFGYAGPHSGITNLLAGAKWDHMRKQ